MRKIVCDLCGKDIVGENQNIVWGDFPHPSRTDLRWELRIVSTTTPAQGCTIDVCRHHMAELRELVDEIVTAAMEKWRSHD